MKVLLAVDGSEHSKRMLAHMAEHDDLLGADREYLVVNVVPAVSPHAARYLDRKTLEAYYSEEAQVVLEPVISFAKQRGWKARGVPLKGHAAEEIAALAEREKCDLIVMGTHGQSSLVNLVLGSVTTGVLARCRTPVLLIR